MPIESPRHGLVSFLGLLVGIGCLIIAAVGALNTAFEWHLSLGVYGTQTSLPASWDEVGGLAAAGTLIVALSWFGGEVRRRFVAAKGRPWLRIGIVLVALALVIGVARGLWYVAIRSTYGSMLAYYATDGDLDDVRSELARGPDRRDLDDAVFRAAQYDNAAALALLLEAGADFRGLSYSEGRRCVLVGRTYAFVKTAIDHGVRRDSCPDGDDAIWATVNLGHDDATVAATVALLRDAGWSASVTPTYARQSAVELARAKQMSQTLAMLQPPPS